MSFKQFHSKHINLNGDDDTTRRIVTAALTASRAAYCGQVEFNSERPDDEFLKPGDTVQVEGNPGQTMRVGKIIEVCEADCQVKVKFPDSEPLYVPDNIVSRVNEVFVDAAYHEMNKVDVGATKMMMSTDGSIHPHLVVEAQLFGSQALPTLIVACRGSVTKDDWKADFSASLDPDKKGGWEGQVHGGFLARAATISIEPMIDHVTNGGTVLLTGHSLGSAVAEVLALKIAFHFSARAKEDDTLLSLAERIAFVGFASPVIAVEGLAVSLGQHCIPFTIFHHMHMSDDAVPLLSNLYAWRNSIPYQRVSAVLQNKAVQLVATLAAGEAVVLRSLLLQFCGRQAIDYFRDKWRTLAPDLCKCYGRWYCLSETESKIFNIVFPSDRLLVAENDCNILSAISIDTFKRRVALHSVFVYPAVLKHLLLPECQRVRNVCVPAYVRSLTQIQLPSIAEYHAVRSEFTATISRFPYISLVDHGKATLTIQGTGLKFPATGASMRSLGSNELQLHFSAKGFALNTGDRVLLRLTSVYCVGKEPETVESGPLLIEPDSKGHQFAEALNRGLFLALSNVKAPGFYDGNEDLAAALQCRLKRLEAIACERALFEPQASSRVPLAIDRFPMEIELVQGGFFKTVHIVPVKEARALYHLRETKDDSFLRVDPKPDGGWYMADFNSKQDDAAKLSFNLEADGKSYSMRDEKTGLLLTIYRRFPATPLWSTRTSLWFYPLNLDDRWPTIFSVLETTSRKPVLPGLHGPLTVCSRILTYQYLSSDCNRDFRAKVKIMLDNPTEYLDTLKQGSPEYVRNETSKKCTTDPNRFLRADWSKSLLSVVDTECFGLPLACSLRDLFADWELLLNTPRLAVPPVTRYYFAGLTTLSDIAMTVCHTVSRSFRQSQSVWYKEWFCFWAREQSETSLSREYNLRVLFLCLEIANPQSGNKGWFEDLRGRFKYDSPKKETELRDLIVANNVTLEYLNTLILDLSKYCTDPVTGELMEAKFRENLRRDCAPELAKALFFVFRLVEGAAKLAELCRRVQVAVVFGPEKCGKTTLLEELTGKKFLNKTNDANGNTKEPFLAMSLTSGAAKQMCLSCAKMHCAHSTNARYHLLYDLPGNTDLTKRGGEMRALQLLILGVVRALIVIQPIDEQGVNQKRFELLANISPTTRAIVLLAKPNARFESIKSKLVNDGVLTDFYSVVDHPGSLFFSWETKVFVAPEAEIKKFMRNEEVLPSKVPASNDSSSSPVPDNSSLTAAARIVVTSNASGLSLSQGPVTVVAEKFAGALPPGAKTVTLTLVWPSSKRSADSITTQFPKQPLKSDRQEVWLAHFEAIRQLLEQDKSKYRVLLQTFEDQLRRVVSREDTPHKMLNSINCSLKEEKKPAGNAEDASTSNSLQSYGRAQLVWSDTQEVARKAAQDVFLDLRKLDIRVNPEAIQLYIPRMESNFRSTFHSQREYTTSGVTFESFLDLKERSEFCGDLLVKVAVSNDGKVVEEDRMPIVDPMNATSELDAQLCAAFTSAQHEVILDQHDVQSLMSTSLAFKESNPDLQKCLGLGIVSASAH